MKHSIFLKPILILQGIVGIAVGIGQLFLPHSFEASAGISIGQNANLLSEIRASGGTLFAAGCLILWGALRAPFRIFALQISILFYLSYGFSRVFSMLIDGVPCQSLVIAMFAELFFGVLSAIYYLQWSSK